MKRLGMLFVGLLLVNSASHCARPAAPSGMAHVEFEGSAALLLRNDRIEFTMLPERWRVRRRKPPSLADDDARLNATKDKTREQAFMPHESHTTSRSHFLIQE